jgi:hypothetical protein
MKNFKLFDKVMVNGSATVYRIIAYNSISQEAMLAEKYNPKAENIFKKESQLEKI